MFQILVYLLPKNCKRLDKVHSLFRSNRPLEIEIL